MFGTEIPQFTARVRVNGSEIDTLYKCIQSITVEEDVDQGSSFDIRLTMCRNEDGTWPFLNDARFKPWNRVTIVAAFADSADVVIDGYISHINPSTNKETGNMAVAMRGLDASSVLGLEEKCKVWTAQTYEDIAKAILTSYGFNVVLPTDTGAASGGQLPAVTQRSTDLRFLRELARRKGYEFYVVGGEAHFHPPSLDGAPQKIIAVKFGDKTNCDELHLELDGTKPTEIQMDRYDPLEGTQQSGSLSASDLPSLGATQLSELRGAADVPQKKVILRREGAFSEADMKEYLKGFLRRHGWWIKAEGTLNGISYGQVLRARKLVTIMGVGETYNGDYYVKNVTHKMGQRSYAITFTAYRNAMGKKGTENFDDAQGVEGEPVTVLESGPVAAPA
jgi:uncharacterized protein